MKAVQIHGHGGVGQLRYEDSEEPALQSDTHVIVKLKAASVNRIDLALRTGTESCAQPLPRILGADGAGIVYAAGARVSNVKPGDAVCLFPFYDCTSCKESLCNHRELLGACRNGTYAEYICVPAKNCFARPPGLTFEQAAALPLAYSMAWRMLITDAALKPGEWVMIFGAGGGIASAALHMAICLGARVIAVSSCEKKLATARNMGAAHGIRSDEKDFFKAVRALTGKRGVDVALNCVGGESWTGSLAALARGGRLVTCGALAGATPQTDLRRLFWNHLQILAAGSATREEFVRVLDFFAAGQHKPVVDETFSLKDTGRAHERLERHEQFGKIVVRIDE